MDTAPSEGINSALSAKANSADRSAIVVDPELAELFSGALITPDDLRRVYLRLSAIVALSKQDAAEADYARCEELVFPHQDVKLTDLTAAVQSLRMELRDLQDRLEVPATVATKPAVRSSPPREETSPSREISESPMFQLLQRLFDRVAAIDERTRPPFSPDRRVTEMRPRSKGAAPSFSPTRDGPGYDGLTAGTVPLVAPEPNYAVLSTLGHYISFCRGPEVPALGEYETLLMSFKLVVSYRAYRLKDIDPVVRSEQSKLVRRGAKEFKRLTGERTSLDGSKPIKLLSFLRTVQKTFNDGGVSEGLAARALYYLLGGEAQDFYTSRVTTAVIQF